MQTVRLVILVMFTIAVLCASYAAGNTVFEVLRFDVSARAASLGGSFITISDDPNVLFYNPATLATLSTSKVSVGFFKHLLDINSGNAVLGSEIPGYGKVAVGFNYINYGKFKRTGEEGQVLGTFSANEFAVSAAFAGELVPKLNYGAGAKFIYSSIADYMSTAAAVDFGVYYTAIPSRLTLGASLLNFGTQLDPYISKNEKLPLDLKLGASLSPEHLPAVIMLGFHRLTDTREKLFDHFRNFSLGVEFTVSPNVQLRLGYNNEQRRELKLGTTLGMAGFSLGTRIQYNWYSFDYAYNSLGKIGGFHRINLGFSW